MFLSYASADVSTAERVATTLTRAGYDVWWDRHLLSGERFQRTIERELNAAAAVLVLWTKASVGSEWVYSEARRGGQRRALVHLRARDVAIDDLPAPFDGRHCPYLDDEEAVLRAVAAHAGPSGSGVGVRARTLTLVHQEPGGLQSVYSSALEAVIAALSLPGDVAVGVHTGTPTAHEDGWIGMDATRAARVAQAASRGQVLVTEPTAALLRDVPDVRLRDLGSHGFRELPHPERLHQAERPGEPRTFPPVRSLGSVTGLPRLPTQFLGREDDLREAAEAVCEGPQAVVTIAGPGGMGKTRLALAVAERVAAQFDGGVFFVPLETVTDGDGMWSAIGAVLGLPEDEQVAAGVTAELAHGRCLLVLDNLEQLPAAGAVVTQLVAACPELRVLATSRGPVHAQGEQEIALGPLDLEPDAVALFVRQARLVRRGFALDDNNREDVLAICRSLDCLPLALSLAAARLRLLTPAALRDRLDDVLDVADRSREGRHRTLRATIEWSHDLLTDEQRRLLGRLAVFPAGAPLEAVDSLVALEALTDASLVEVRDEAGGPRVRLLNTTRAYALERLTASGDAEAAYGALARWGRALVEDPRRWTASSTAEWARSAGIRAELDNLRAALEWLVDRRDGRPDPAALDEAVALAATYASYAAPGQLAEARRWLEAAVNADGGTPSLTRAAGCLQLAWELARTDPTVSGSLTERGRELYDALPEAERSGPRGRATLALAAELDAVAKWRSGDLEGARADLDALLAGELPDGTRLLLMVTLSGLVAAMGDAEGALTLERQGALLARGIGDLTQALVLEVNVGCSLRELGRPQEALDQMNRTIPLLLAESPPVVQLPSAAEDYVGVLVDLGQVEPAALLWGAAQALRARYEVPMPDSQQAETAATVEAGRRLLGSRWDQLVAQGRGHDVEPLLLETLSGVRVDA